MALALLLTLTWSGALRAHEVLPSIADLSVEGDRLTLEMSANLEGFVAGIDLSETSDTNETPQAEDYDALRALSPEELEERFRIFWPRLAGALTLEADGEPLTPDLEAVEVGPVGNTDLPRESRIVISAALPGSAEAVRVGWAREFGALVVRQMGVEAPYDGYLDGGALSPAIAIAGGGQVTGWQSFLDYVPVGFDHIVPKGLDHILFVLGIFFLAPRLRPLLLQVSLFTVAHTITLALAALGHTEGLDRFSQASFGIPFIAIVEPLIALSIVYVAVENIFTRGLSPWRPFVVFLFGLLHGLGFASVLAEFGLPEATFIPALLGFNVGVELGQLFVIGVVFLCVWQALRVDRGANEARRGYILYGSLFALAVLVAVWNPAGLQLALEGPAWIFAAPLAALFALSILSIRNRDHLAAYRRIVAVPASLGIAVVGLWWFIERTFL